ncbi:MAG TPA: hypothetical protein ENN88_01160, partial [Candidatus Coatesbacteria bacterium]|nr:hypothetical protein [Candidatus Coatesbacteria bacterium]
MRLLVILALVIALPSAAGIKVAFMVAEYDPLWSEAIDFLKADPRIGLVDWIVCTTFTPPLG